MRIRPEILLLLLIVIAVGLCGCQQRPQSSFDDWQPPPIRPQELRSDVVLPSDQPGPAVMPKIVVEEPSGPAVAQIMVSIREQRLRAYDGSGKLLKEYPVSTAAGGIILPLDEDSEKPHNHVGVFVIDHKDAKHVSGQYNSPMPYALHFWEGHWIHATEERFYVHLGSPASHGCVRLRLDNAKWLFENTPVGCKLIITAD